MLEAGNTLGAHRRWDGGMTMLSEKQVSGVRGQESEALSPPQISISPSPPAVGEDAFQNPTRRPAHQTAPLCARTRERSAGSEAESGARCHRSRHGESHRSAAGNRDRQAGRGGPRPEQPWLQQVNRHPESAARSRRQVLQEVRRAARPRDRSHRHHRLEGRLQPHVPGADGPGRHGDRSRRRSFPFTCTPSRWRRAT